METDSAQKYIMKGKKKKAAIKDIRGNFYLGKGKFLYNGNGYPQNMAVRRSHEDSILGHTQNSACHRPLEHDLTSKIEYTEQVGSPVGPPM